MIIVEGELWGRERGIRPLLERNYIVIVANEWFPGSSWCTVVDVEREVLWVPDEVFRDVEILLICVSSNTETESSYALF